MVNEKKRANRNSIRHGIFATIVLSGDGFGEEKDQLLALLSMLRTSIPPANSFEEVLIEKLAFLHLRLTRLYRADAKIAPRLFKRVSDFLGPGNPSIKTKWISPDDQMVVVQRDPTSESLMRYESNLERQIGRTFGQLEILQRIRRSSLTSPDPISEASDASA
jgi:hypothetical protein